MYKHIKKNSGFVEKYGMYLTTFALGWVCVGLMVIGIMRSM